MDLNLYMCLQGDTAAIERKIGHSKGPVTPRRSELAVGPKRDTV